MSSRATPPVSLVLRTSTTASWLVPAQRPVDVGVEQQRDTKTGCVRLRLPIFPEDLRYSVEALHHRVGVDEQCPGCLGNVHTVAEVGRDRIDELGLLTL